MKLVLFLLCCFSLNAVVFKGVDYDDDTVSKMITVITTTSPIPSMPSTKFLFGAQKSLFRIPALAKCKKIIVFDGLKEEDEELSNTYEKYKNNVRKLLKTTPYFMNTKLVFCPKWVHLCGTIRQALKHVETPYVFIHQHDLELIKDFDLNGVIASMEANPEIKYVAFIQNSILNEDPFFGPFQSGAKGVSFVPLCKTSGWTDQCHVASVEYYQTFVLPQCRYTFMECVLHPALKQAVQQNGFSGQWKLFGAFVYGRMRDGPYIYHTHARVNH